VPPLDVVTVPPLDVDTLPPLEPDVRRVVVLRRAVVRDDVDGRAAVERRVEEVRAVAAAPGTAAPRASNAEIESYGAT
jgi:hypothetical protein